MDCGVAATERLDPLLKIANQYSFCMFNVYQLPNIQWCKRDAFIMMECDEPEFHWHTQYNGHCQIFKVNKRSKKYIYDYLLFSMCPSIMDDSPSKLKPEYLFKTDIQEIYDDKKQEEFLEEALNGSKEIKQVFVENRHDQTVQSLLAQQANIPMVKNPCEYGRFLVHHRKKNRGAKIVWGMHPGGNFCDAEKEEGDKIYWTDEQIKQIEDNYARKR